MAHTVWLVCNASVHDGGGGAGGAGEGKGADSQLDAVIEAAASFVFIQEAFGVRSCISIH